MASNRSHKDNLVIQGLQTPHSRALKLCILSHRDPPLESTMGVADEATL